MSDKNPTFIKAWRRVALGLLRYWWLWVIVAGLIAVAVIYHNVATHPPVSLKVTSSTTIDVTPEELRAVRDIGQWEFLSFSTEEMVEWHRHRPFGNDHLVRIYSGTLRLGVDLSQAGDDWFTSLPDSTARLVLPPVQLLDTHFIDEAHTRSFYQRGSVPADTLEVLYDRAREAMLARCMTPDRLRTAERNAREEFTRIFQSLGFKRVEITFAPSPSRHV